MNIITSGVNQLDVDANGKSVAEIRKMLSQALNISPESQPILNGEHAVNEDYILQAADQIEFVKSSGEKG